MPRLCGLRNTDWFWPSVLGVLVVLGAVAETSADDQPGDKPQPKSVPAAGEPKEKEGAKLAKAVVAGGCFWCTEAVFEQLRGVTQVTSGYIGGQVDHPTYKDVCNGTTGHAEALQITYDPAQISFETLLEVFWKTHDPTTLNRQGNDVGTQYRSGIFYHTPEQKSLALEYKAKLDASGAFDKPIVTEITPASTFWPAEEYHQGYFRENPTQGYCRVIIAPKVEKFRKVFADKLKP